MAWCCLDSGQLVSNGFREKEAEPMMVVAPRYSSMDVTRITSTVIITTLVS